MAGTRIKCARTAVIGVATVVIGGGAAQGVVYSITDLGSLSGWTVPRRIADTGAVTGSTTASDWHSRGFSWDGALVAIPTFGPETESQGIDLIDADDTLIVAYSLGKLGARAVRVQSGVPTELGDFTPSAMNASGVAVGSRSVAGGTFGVLQTQAVVSAGGVVSALPFLSGGNHASAFDIDSAGNVVGSAVPGNGLRPRATLWADGIVHDLGTLGGASAQALGISDGGYVCGVSATASAPMHAFRAHLSGATVDERLDLGTLGGGWSVAYGVNDAGWVVGTSDDRAFVWVDGAMWDLNTAIDPNSGWHLIGATGVNNAFEIVGWGDHGAEGIRAFLFTFTPAPTCVGDVTGDGKTDIADFNVLAGHFGTTSGALPTDGDLTGDGAVDSADFNVLAGDFGCGG